MGKNKSIAFKAKYHEYDHFELGKNGVYIIQEMESGAQQTAYLTYEALEEIVKEVQKMNPAK